LTSHPDVRLCTLSDMADDFARRRPRKKQRRQPGEEGRVKDLGWQI
jgi:hypothetical protein